MYEDENRSRVETRGQRLQKPREDGANKNIVSANLLQIY